MKEFLSSTKGNTILWFVSAVVVFVLLDVVFGLGGAIGGAIAGVSGFGIAEVVKNVLKPKEKSGEDTKAS